MGDCIIYDCKEKQNYAALLTPMLLALLLSGQCTAQDDDVLFQVSTIDALMQGVFDGFYSFNDLMVQGDFGIGTFDALEGEMIALDPVAKIPEYKMAACRIETLA